MMGVNVLQADTRSTEKSCASRLFEDLAILIPVDDVSEETDNSHHRDNDYGSLER